MSIFQLIQYHMLDAMIVLPDTIKRDSVLQSIIDSCRSHNVPVISIDKFLEGCVNFRFDYSNSFETLCQHVVQKHHAKRLFMMAGVRDNTFSDERIHAFEKVRAENNITPDNYRIGYGDFWEKPTRETLEQWFIEEQCAIPDAIICCQTPWRSFAASSCKITDIVSRRTASSPDSTASLRQTIMYRTSPPAPRTTTPWAKRSLRLPFVCTRDCRSSRHAS